MILSFWMKQAMKYLKYKNRAGKQVFGTGNYSINLKLRGFMLYAIIKLIVDII